MLPNPDPADWLMWRRTLNSWGYSPLKEINRKQRRAVANWSGRGRSARAPGGHAARHDGIMYFPNPSDIMQAFDAVTGDLLWEYRRSVPGGRRPILPGGGHQPQSRDLRQLDHRHERRRLSSTRSMRRPASSPGKRSISTIEHGAKQTSGPIVANGKVISGRSCEPEGGPRRASITAHDAKTGKELWRHRTIPEPGEPGDETWGNIPYEQRWHVGTWMVPSYDPSSNSIYVGTSVTSPAPKFMLAGNNKQYLYHNSTLALDADTGKIVWYYQHVVDHWDLDHPFERLIVDTAVAPDPQEVTWINPKPAARRAAQGDHRHPGQDRHRLHARPRRPASSCGRGRRSAERDQQHRRRDGRGRR